MINPIMVKTLTELPQDFSRYLIWRCFSENLRKDEFHLAINASIASSARTKTYNASTELTCAKKVYRYDHYNAYRDKDGVIYSIL
jgi:hypothetical protein